MRGADDFDLSPEFREAPPGCAAANRVAAASRTSQAGVNLPAVMPGEYSLMREISRRLFVVRHRRRPWLSRRWRSGSGVAGPSSRIRARSITTASSSSSGSGTASYPGWSYDYPEMEQNLTLILKDVSVLPRASGRQQHLPDGRSGAAEIPGRLPVGAGLLVSERQRSAGTADLPGQGRLPHRRRLPFRQRVARLRGGDAEGAAGRADRPARPIAPGLQQLLLDQVARRPLSRAASASRG